MVIGTKRRAKGRGKKMPSKYQYYIHTWVTKENKTGIPPIRTGVFEFVCVTDDLGKAHLIGSLLDGAGHKVTISRPGESDEERLRQLEYRNRDAKYVMWEAE
jgi:hypothetical protein